MKIKKILKISILTLLMLFVINKSYALTPSISVGTSGLNNDSSNTDGNFFKIGGNSKICTESSGGNPSYEFNIVRTSNFNAPNDKKAYYTNGKGTIQKVIWSLSDYSKAEIHNYTGGKNSKNEFATQIKGLKKGSVTLQAIIYYENNTEKIMLNINVSDTPNGNNFSNQGASTTQTPVDSTSGISMALSGVKGESRKGNLFTKDVLENIDKYKPNDIDSTSAGKIETATSKILTVISNIGIAVSVIMLAILGIKYMMGSVEEKAEYKQGLVPYVIGAFVLFGITTFVKILMAFGDKIANI